MAKTKISEFSSTPGNNTDIDGINIAEGCAPSGINDAIRELMSQLKDFQTGSAGDSFNGPVGTTTAAAGAFTTLSASSTVSGSGFSTYLASPPAIGATTPSSAKFTSITNTGLTSGRVVYSGASGVQTDSANLTFNGTTLSAGGFSTTGNSTLVKLVTIGDSGFTTGAVLAAATPAKLYIGTGAVTDGTSAGGATNTLGTITAFGQTQVIATNANVTYTNLATLYIAGAPTAGTNVTITNPYSLYIAAGAAYFGGGLTFAGQLNVTDTTDSSSTSTGSIVTAGGVGIAKKLFVGLDANIYGITVGRGAGAVATNTAVGASALAANTTGAQGAYFGWRSGYSNTTGDNNAAFGDVTLYSNTTGSANTALGRQALYSNTTASNNTAVGYQAGYSNTTAINSTAIGYQALYANDANLNTAVGMQAVRNNVSGLQITALGYQAGLDTTASFGTFVGAQSGGKATTGTLNTFVGWASGYEMLTGAKNTILGGYNGNQGGLDIRTANNYIVLSDGDGNPWAAISGTEWIIGANTATTGDLISNGGGNSTAYNGIIIAANKRSLSGQANTGLYSWFIDIGGRAADGSTRPVTTSDKFTVARQAAGGTIYGSDQVLEINANGCLAVGVNTTAASTGAGITFPATQSASSNANTLDDYEEGDLIPGWNGGTLTVYGCKYVKVGRLVSVAYDILFGSSASSATAIIDLPFNATGSGTYAGGYINYTDKGNATYALNIDTGFGNPRCLAFREAINSSSFNCSNIAGSRWIFTVTYYASA